MDDDKQQDDIIEKFLDKDNIFAVIGVSKNPKKYGNKIFHDLKSAGYHVYPINPNMATVDSVKCYPSIRDLPEIPDVIDVVVPPKVAEKVVKEAITLGIKKVWLQPGSESEAIINCCKDAGVLVLHDICIMVERRR